MRSSLPASAGDTADAAPAMGEQETIVALSTPAGVGAIGIVRMSGPGAAALGSVIFRPATGLELGSGEAGRLRYGHAVDPETSVVLDEVLAVLLKAPATYTREDVVEVHCHGGPAAQRGVLQTLIRLGARPAEPGEFTKRAYLNGRIDLAQAESVAAIVKARSASALRASVRQLSGGLSTRIVAIRAKLVGALAQVEAGIDFSEEDLDELDRDGMLEQLLLTAGEIEDLLRTALLGRALEQGVRTAIIGRPNVGKSSLLNALLMRERAIVSEIPGTTRDTVEDLVEIAGIPLHLVDTAGLRASDDVVERLGIERSREASRDADLVLAVFDMSSPPGPEDSEVLAGVDPDRAIIVANKLDLAEGGADQARDQARDQTPEHARDSEIDLDIDHGEALEPDPVLQRARRSLAPLLEATGVSPDRWRVRAVSSLTGQGLESLRETIELIAVGDHGVDLDEPMLATERQRLLVDESLAALNSACEGLASAKPDELIAEDVRMAARSLGRITGEELVPDLIDEIFRRFCIGK